MAKDDPRKSLLKQGSKKKKSFRGLITGKSKKDKKNGSQKWTEPEPFPEPESIPESEAPVTQKKPVKPLAVVQPVKKTPEPKAIDEETVYGADFDEASKAQTAATTETPTNESVSEAITDPIAIVLLLMDPASRRFELLQLEFDTTRATVADILQQIPISATEESLRTQKFDIVCDPAGLEYDHDKPLSDYVSGNAVVVTVPKSDTEGSVHAAKMARPILRDPKVEEMLRSAGVHIPLPQASEAEIKKVVTTRTTVEEKAPPTPTSSSPSMDKPVVSKPSTTESSSSETQESSSYMNLLIIAAVIAYVTHSIVNFQGQITTPLGPGSTLVPGAWKSRCGLVQSNGCKPAYIEMGLDGTLQIVENEGISFSLIGNVCGEEEEDCIPGAVIQENGTIRIGGSVPKLGRKSKFPVNPWPFVEGVGSAKGKKAWF